MRGLFHFALLLLLSPLVLAGEPPTPPTGYDWVTYEEGKLSVLCPQSWFVKKEVQNDTIALFVSKEDIDKNNGLFQTGFSMNYMQRVSTHVHASPSTYASGLIATIAKLHPPVLKNETAHPAPGISTFTLRINDNSRLQITTEYLVVADDPRDTMRVISFEAPAEEWDAAWKIGDTMLKNLILQ